jgi:hypothetical protein
MTMKAKKFVMGEILENGGSVIDGPITNGHGGNLWLFKCKCGIEMWKSTSRINSTKHGCRNCFFESKKLQYHIGKNFDNGYTIIDGPIKPTGSTSKTETWKVRCDNCGKEIWRQASNITRSNCQACWGMSKRKMDGTPALNKAFNQLKSGARHRKILVEINFDDFLKISKQDCTYCGCPPTIRKGERSWHITKINGIDRVDNNLGYVPGNIVPCCWQCNQSKSNLTLEEWKSWLRKVSERTLNDGS